MTVFAVTNSLDCFKEEECWQKWNHLSEYTGDFQLLNSVSVEALVLSSSPSSSSRAPSRQWYSCNECCSCVGFRLRSSAFFSHLCTNCSPSMCQGSARTNPSCVYPCWFPFDFFFFPSSQCVPITNCKVFIRSDQGWLIR